MNCEKKAQGIIDEVIKLLDEKHVSREIDERIEKAAARFKFDREAAPSHALFNQIISDFVMHMFEEAIRLPIRLTPSQAKGEAVAILEQYYEGSQHRGYYAAYLDFLDSAENGIMLLIARMTEAIKAIERRKYVRWVYLSRIDQSDWTTGCRLVKVLLDRLNSYLPPRITQCDPAQLVDCLPDLLMTCLDTESTRDQILAGHFSTSLGLKQTP
jgi:hypothetical protein